MNQTEKIKLITDVFAPQPGEKILILVDTPHNQITVNPGWQERINMAHEWQELFQLIGQRNEFPDHVVDYLEFPATGINNSPLPPELLDKISEYNLVCALTEFSASSSLKPLCNQPNLQFRVASMPGIEKRMEETSLKADYQLVKRYALALQKLLNQSDSCDITFSTGDTLHLDLRNRTAQADKGECTTPGQFINFPSGEAFKVPYEAVKSEITQFGPSQTNGILPYKENDQLIKFVIKENKITEIQGDNPLATKLREYLWQNPTRLNIAELGLGCNPLAVVTGNILEDEKVGLHIAYGTSSHLGGQITSDIHQDIVYAQGCPVEGSSLVLNTTDNQKINLITNSQLNYELL